MNLARHLLLDFEGRRLRGVRPFALLQAKDGAWTWRISNARAPFGQDSE